MPLGEVLGEGALPALRSPASGSPYCAFCWGCVFFLLFVVILGIVSCVLLLLFSLSHVQLVMTPWTAACQASLSFTISQSLLKLMSIELVMPSNRLILLLLLSIFPSIRVFSHESALCIR